MPVLGVSPKIDQILILLFHYDVELSTDDTPILIRDDETYFVKLTAYDFKSIGLSYIPQQRSESIDLSLLNSIFMRIPYENYKLNKCLKMTDAETNYITYHSLFSAYTSPTTN